MIISQKQADILHDRIDNILESEEHKARFKLSELKFLFASRQELLDLIHTGNRIRSITDEYPRHEVKSLVMSMIVKLIEKPNA